MHLFFTPDISSTSEYILNEDESKHCIRVLRLQKGDKVILIDGKGGKYDATIEDDNVKRCKVSIINIHKEKQRATYSLRLAIAPTKNNDRLEWFIEKATEIGIDEISLIQCEHSERITVKAERMERVAISAIKQSVKSFLPKINGIITLKEFLKQTKTITGHKFIAHCYEPFTEKKHIKNLYIKNNDVLVLIGPEGDFTIDEVKQALNEGFQEISLGNSRLRTETAALYAITALNIANN
jgi:16S rRNA (uracil1498-N3)-methyltransferase